MQLKKKSAELVTEAIDQWEAESLIDKELAITLKGSIEVTKFDWKRLAKFSFWFAIGCFVISVSSLFVSPVFQELVKIFSKLFKFVDPKLVSGIVTAGLSGLFYFWGLKRRITHPKNIFKNQAIFFFGILLTASSIGLIASLFKGDNVSIIFLLASVIYLLLGLYFPSRLTWVFGLVSLASWFGCETGYESGWGTYYLGMNYPLRFIPFSCCLIALAYYFNRSNTPNKLKQFAKTTFIIGILYLFMSLWILSIWGNYAEISGSRFVWSIVFGLAALGSIYHGLRFDNGVSKGFGVTFFLINLYTKFFELFWGSWDKSIFFAILGISFWLIGSNAEKVWLINAKNQDSEKGDFAN
jgi:hypothetical protein